MLGRAFRLASLAGKLTAPAGLLRRGAPRWSRVEFTRCMSSGESESSVSSSIWRFFSGGRQVREEVVAVEGGEESAASSKRPTGLHRKCGLRGPLAVFMGKTEASRIEVLRFVWAYIKERGLQKQDNKRIIVADAKLLPLVETAELSMFELTKVLNKYIENLPNENAASADASSTSDGPPKSLAASQPPSFSAWN